MKITKVININPLGGIGLSGATFLLLLALKLSGAAALSWWVVTLPFWVVPALVVGACAAVGSLVGLGLVGYFVLFLGAIKFLAWAHRPKENTTDKE